MALTATTVEKIKAKAARFELPDGTVRGLYLSVLPSGAKSFLIRYRHHGRPRNYSIGAFPTVKLGDARRLAADAMLIVAAGRDPGEEKKEARRKAEEDRAAAILIRDAFKRYQKEHAEAETAESTQAQTAWLFTKFILPAIGGLTIAEVTAEDCKAIWDKERRRGRKSNANKIFVALRGFFNWLRAELIMTRVSPLDGLKPPPGSEGGKRTLNAAELRLVWLAAEEMEYPFGPFVQLLTLTLARRNEVGRMVRPELDTPGALWTIPPTRTKNKLEHVVPLSDLALSIINRIHNYIASDAQFVFTTDGTHASSNFSKNKRALDAIVTEKNGGTPLPRWTLHDLRRTGDTEMHELGVAPHIVEACVNHISGHKKGVAGTYNKAKYLKEKRAAFTLWAEHVVRIAEGV
jgi:integrase